MSGNTFARMAAALAAGATLSLGAAAQAAVITTGCGGDGCNLGELTSGGTITVDDVTFDSWAFKDEGSSFGGLLDDLGTRFTVTGSSDATTVTLDFAIDPALALGPEDFVEWLIDFNAAVTSTRTITGTVLSLVGTTLSGDDNFAATQVGLVIGGVSGAVEVSAQRSEGITTEDLVNGRSLGALTALAAVLDIQGEAEQGMAATLSSFSLAFTLDGDLPPDDVIPIPGAAILMLTGLAGAGALRRRSAKA